MDIFEQPVLFYLNTVLLLSKWILKNMMGSEAMGLLEGIDSNVQRKERERLPTTPLLWFTKILTSVHYFTV